MRHYIMGFIMWYWPYFLFGSIIYLVLLICCILSLSSGISRKRKHQKASKYFLSFFILLAVLLGTAVFVILQSILFWKDALQ